VTGKSRALAGTWIGGCDERNPFCSLFRYHLAMKLRVQGSSLRLRISRSDLKVFLEAGLLEETTCFGRERGAELTYALERDKTRQTVAVESSPHRVAVILPDEIVENWAATEQVGISARIDLGIRGTLSVLVEKDFACLDRNEEDNADTFPNPLAGSTC
jgi:hypothetical protein